MVLSTDSQHREHPQHFMKRRSVYVTLSLLYASFAVAQQSSTSAVSQAGTGVQQNTPELKQNAPVLAPPRLNVVQSVRVTTTVEPLPLAESDRSVEVISPSKLPAENNSVVDLLRVDLRRAVAGSEYTKPEPHRGGSKRPAEREFDPAGAAELYRSTGGESSEWDHFGVRV